MSIFGPQPGFRKFAICFSALFVVLACVLVVIFLKADDIYQAYFEGEVRVITVFQRQGLDGLIKAFSIFGLACAFVALVGAFSSWVRKEWALRAIRKCLFAFYLPAFFLSLIVWKGMHLLASHPTLPKITYGLEEFTPYNVFVWRWQWLWPLALVALVAGVMHLTTWRRRMIDAYEGVDTLPEDELDAPGDRFLENVRTHGRDPNDRRSKLASVFLHIFILIILPWLLGLFGWVTPYLVPKGRGEPVVTQIQVVKKKKKKRKMIVNPNSPIDFNFPEIDDLMKEVEEESRDVYVANNKRSAKGGKMGAGGKGPGGWPDGTGNEPIRFIRLEYKGPAWNDGMDMRTRADVNFLEEFQKQTGFKIARKGESHPIYYLSKYPKGFAPPFVYMTGCGGISTSAADRQALRQYLLGGGLLFADCGGPGWSGAFRGFIKSVLPEYSLVDIADDDPIYRQPYGFPNGAPPLWHHGGSRALGMRHGSRLMVFFYPGDMNDAWKTGRSGLTQDKADAAFEMGINILYYAFTNYLELTRKYRKK